MRQPGLRNQRAFSVVLLLAASALAARAGLSPCERFYSALPLVWLGTWLAAGRRPQKLPPFVVGIVLGGFAALWLGLTVYARILGGRLPWTEPFVAAYLLVSVGLLYRMVRWAVFGVTALFPPGTGRVATKLRTGARVTLIAFLFIPYVVATFAVHRPKVANRLTPRSVHLPFWEVSLPTSDGVRLHAWFIPSDHKGAAAVLCHGVGVNMQDCLPAALLLHDAGIGVLMFDFRGHGASQGRTISFGWREARDVRAAVDYLASRREVDSERLLGYAFSMGGSALLHCAAQDERIQAVVTDSAFANFRSVAEHRIGFLSRPLARGLITAASEIARLEWGVPLDTVTPEQWVKELHGRPLLIIHGEEDGVVPVEQAHRLYASASEPKELWVLPHCGHVAALATKPDEYRRKLTAFVRGPLLARRANGGVER